MTETFHARKAIHSWYSYGVLAQRSGFKARDYLLRVMKGDKRLSADGAERLAGALDLSAREQEYFLALVDYNQAKKDEQREAAWERLQKALGKGRHASPPRLLTSIHREVLSEWHHLALRSLLELRPSPDDEEALGKRLRPTRSAAAVRRSLKLLEQGGLIERRADGLWHATDKSLATPPEVGPPAFGHGPNGEKWKLEEQLNEMVNHVLELLHDDHHFLILNAYSLGLSSLILENLLKNKAKENLEIGELYLAATSGSICRQE